MKDKNKRQAIILCIVGVLTLITLVVGATFAYFKAQGGAGGSSDVNVITATTDLLTFKIDKAINIGITQNELKKVAQMLVIQPEHMQHSLLVIQKMLKKQQEVIIYILLLIQMILNIQHRMAHQSYI